MPAKIIDGNVVAEGIRKELAGEVEKLKASGAVPRLG